MSFLYRYSLVFAVIVVETEYDTYFVLIILCMNKLLLSLYCTCIFVITEFLLKRMTHEPTLSPVITGRHNGPLCTSVSAFNCPTNTKAAQFIA